MRLWINKPIYELLPYAYLIAGVASLAASTYLDFWYWPVICVAVGLLALIAGLVVWLKRHGHRHSQSSSSAEDA